MYVCVCHAVTDSDIGAAVAEGCCSLRELRDRLGVTSCCGRCASCARSVLQKSLSARPHHHAAATLRMSAA